MSELKVLTAEEQVANILRADRRKVWGLTALTLLAWAVTVGLALLLGSALQSERRYMEKWDIGLESELNRVRSARGIPLAEKWAVEARFEVRGLQWQLQIAAVTIASLAVPALCTLALIHASRRATLRQIQASLADIAAQLAALRPAQ